MNTTIKKDENGFWRVVVFSGHYGEYLPNKFDSHLEARAFAHELEEEWHREKVKEIKKWLFFTEMTK